MMPRSALVAAAALVLTGAVAVVVTRPDRVTRVATVHAGRPADGAGDGQDATPTTDAGAPAPTTSPTVGATREDATPTAGPGAAVTDGTAPPPVVPATAAPTTPGSPSTPAGPRIVGLRATATTAQGAATGSAPLWTGTITVTFDRPVDLGTAPLAALYLVVFGADPACGTPAGNSHMVITGAGTATLTLDATSLAAPTTYVSVVSGFATAVGAGAANETLPCTAVPTSAP